MHAIELRSSAFLRFSTLASIVAFASAVVVGEETARSEPATTRTVTLSGQEIEFLAPEGFFEVSGFAPGVHDRVAATLTAQQQLLGIFLSQDDIDRIRQGDPPRFERYFKVSARRDASAHMIDEPGFEAVRKRFASNTGLIGKNGFEKVPPSEMQRFAQPGAVAYGETLIVRVISESPWHVTLGTLSNQDPNGNPPILVAGTTSVARLGNRVVDIDGYALMTGPQTAREVGEATVAWIEALVLAARDEE